MWSLFLAAGYLKADKLAGSGYGKRQHYILSITNAEVSGMFEDMAGDWFAGELTYCWNPLRKAETA